MDGTVSRAAVTSEGNPLATAFHDKTEAVRCWSDLLDTCGIQRNVIAQTVGVSEGQFSKLSSGQQGDLLGLVYLVGRFYPDLRRDFFTRLNQLEQIDPVTVAAEQLLGASIHFLRVVGSPQAVRARMEKAGLRLDDVA